MRSWLKKIKFPSLISSLLAVLSAVLLILAFPDFEFWFLAYVALIPLFFAIEREKESKTKSFFVGWIFGTVFFTGTCWWLTYAPITYGGVPTPLAYLLLLGATLTVGLFPALFALLLGILLKRFGSWAMFSAPFLWTAIEFLRFWTTGNNWNAIAYSQAFYPFFLSYASFGGIYLVGFVCVVINSFCSYLLTKRNLSKVTFAIIPIATLISVYLFQFAQPEYYPKETEANLIAIQPNVPMSSLKYEEWLRLRNRHLELAEREIQKLKETPQSAIQTPQSIVVFPESPMNFGYTNDRDFQAVLREFTAKNNVQVLFNAAEPSENNGYYNSAVLVNERGEKIAQYDKMNLVPFGEYVPLPEPLASLMPTMVGNFEIGKEYDIIPLGEAKVGIMICFESHFPTLSRQFALRGADVIVEMTNDGFLGNTPILRQHLANAVFRAVETNRPVLRVTNVGITAFINENGTIYEPSKPYTEDTRVWAVSKSDGSQTFYVKYGDWFAWLCSIVSLGLLLVGFWRRNKK